MSDLIKIIQYIVSCSVDLRNKYTDEKNAPVEFVCVFCQNENEYKHFTNSAETLGEIIEDTKSGFTYLLNNPIMTIAGPLRLLKIRKPEISRPERGDADFNTDYENFKRKYQNNPNFELIKRETFEMLRLSDPESDVMACFSSIPKSKILKIKL
jgi:hypothetical protein